MGAAGGRIRACGPPPEEGEASETSQRGENLRIEKDCSNSRHDGSFAVTHILLIVNAQGLPGAGADSNRTVYSSALNLLLFANYVRSALYPASPANTHVLCLVDCDQEFFAECLLDFCAAIEPDSCVVVLHSGRASSIKRDELVPAYATVPVPRTRGLVPVEEVLHAVQQRSPRRVVVCNDSLDDVVWVPTAARASAATSTAAGAEAPPFPGYMQRKQARMLPMTYRLVGDPIIVLHAALAETGAGAAAAGPRVPPPPVILRERPPSAPARHPAAPAHTRSVAGPLNLQQLRPSAASVPARYTGPACMHADADVDEDLWEDADALEDLARSLARLLRSRRAEGLDGWLDFEGGAASPRPATARQKRVALKFVAGNLPSSQASSDASSERSRAFSELVAEQSARMGAGLRRALQARPDGRHRKRSDAASGADPSILAALRDLAELMRETHFEFCRTTGVCKSGSLLSQALVLISRSLEIRLLVGPEKLREDDDEARFRCLAQALAAMAGEVRVAGQAAAGRDPAASSKVQLEVAAAAVEAMRRQFADGATEPQFSMLTNVVVDCGGSVGAILDKG